MQFAIRSGASALNSEVESHGTPTKGTIILIMGLGTQLIAWPMPFYRALIEAGYQVIRYDNRDVGLSTQFESAGVHARISSALPNRRPVLRRETAHP